MAARIVAARPYAEIDELRRVRGLRRATLDRLRPLLTASP
jgi:type II secretory pathway component PulK